MTQIQGLISLIANTVSIISGAIAIISFYKVKGGNNTIYIIENNSPIITPPTLKPVQKSIQLTDDPRILWGIAIIILATILFFYSLAYKLIPAFLLFIFSVFLLNDIKLPFKNKTAQTQWLVKRILTLIPIILLFFTPKSILDIIEQLPILDVNSFEKFVSSFFEMFHRMFILSKESALYFLNIVFRIIAIFGILFFIIKSFKNKEKIHNVQKLPDFIWSIFSVMMMIVLSNFEYFWDILEPLRIIVTNWFVIDL